MLLVFLPHVNKLLFLGRNFLFLKTKVCIDKFVSIFKVCLSLTPKTRSKFCINKLNEIFHAFYSTVYRENLT